jgi:hypothetical protein
LKQDAVYFAQRHENAFMNLSFGIAAGEIKKNISCFAVIK